MKKTVIGLLGLSLVITSSVPAHGMWGRFGSRFGSRFTAAARQLEPRFSRFAQSTKPYINSRSAVFSGGLGTGAGVMYWRRQQFEKKLENTAQELNNKLDKLEEEYELSEEEEYELLKDKPQAQRKNVLQKKLLLACKWGNTDKVRELIKKRRVDPNYVRFLTIGSIVAGYSPLSLAAKEGHIDTVRHLLRMMANVNLPALNGYHGTPLEQALRHKQYDVLKLLLGAGATADSDSVNLLDRALEERDDKAALLFIKNGVQPNKIAHEEWQRYNYLVRYHRANGMLAKTYVMFRHWFGF